MDILKEILKFFTDKTNSTTTKFFGIIVFVLVIFFIDNLLGFSFYYSNNQKINQLLNIEKLKRECPENPAILSSLNEAEEDILQRKNIIKSFFELFSKEDFDIKKHKAQIHIDTVFVERIINSKPFNDTSNIQLLKKESTPKKKETTFVSRSKLWHTLSSSFILIVVLIGFPIIFIFAEKTFNWDTLFVLIFILIFLAGLIWIYQFILGLIPVIMGKVWINYLLNSFIHGFSIWIIIYSIKKKS
ncbi:MAG: hypothetical protein HOO91_18500 [Bacteroidales bacterium]|nr:hypothetical protein [Bacteroidales bacterium]